MVLKAPRDKEERPVTWEEQDQLVSEDPWELTEARELKAQWAMLVPGAPVAISDPPDPLGPREALVSQESRASWVIWV